MITRENQMQICGRYGSEYLLRQLAEECTELATACLHHIRARRKETDKMPDATKENLIEEMADVSVMMDCVHGTLLHAIEQEELRKIADAKANRMVNRLLGDA